MKTTLADLYNAYSGGKGSGTGRFACPIVTKRYGTATHIYCGYGSYRLERINGDPKKGQKGFQGTEVFSTPLYGPKWVVTQTIEIKD